MIEVLGKEIHVIYVKGPVGVQARNLKARIKSLGWETKVGLGIGRT